VATGGSTRSSSYGAIAALLGFGVYAPASPHSNRPPTRTCGQNRQGLVTSSVSGNVAPVEGEVFTCLGGLRGESRLFTDLDAWRNACRRRRGSEKTRPPSAIAAVDRLDVAHRPSAARWGSAASHCDVPLSTSTGVKSSISTVHSRGR